MSIETLKGGNVPVKLWTPFTGVESEALDQLRRIAKLPWVAHHVAVMPDVHYGKGATVGSVIAMRGAVSPAAVGVDIGCGMGAVKTSLRASDLPESLAPLRAAIEKHVPVGFASHETITKAYKFLGLTNDVNALFGRFKDLNRGVEDLFHKAQLQLGTLGGGNHFIELCLDEENKRDCQDCGGEGGTMSGACKRCGGTGFEEPRVWLMLHSGSRNIGKTLAEIHMARAKKLEHNQGLADPDLAAFLAGTPEMAAYRHDLYWAQEYAFLNRRVMFSTCQDVLREHFPGIQFEEPILCHHNYVAEEVHFGEELIVTRKGAIRAGLGEKGIIPGSMGTASYIVRGLGNEESFCSASHGAGRRWSRGKAKRLFTVDDVAIQTAGVECRKDAGVIDELPGAYKDIDEVMAYQSDLVEIVARLKQVMCIKG